MINRVFCYSEDEAKKNGCFSSIKKILLFTVSATLIFCFIIIMTVVLFDDAFENSFGLFAIEMIAFLVIVFYVAIKFSLGMRAKLIGYATDTEGRIYQATKLNNGEELYIGGLAAGSLIDTIAKNSSNIGRDLGGAIGAGAQFYTMYKSAQVMSNPEIIAKMVENGQNISGAMVIEILKVHSYIDKNRCVKLRCDYRFLKNGKIKYNKTLTIYKAYNYFNDLINIAINKK